MRAHMSPASVGRSLLPLGLVLCLVPGVASAYDSLFTRMKTDASLAKIFADGIARADIQEGMLIGTGTEQLSHLPDGRLSLVRKRRYTSLRRPDTEQVARLPAPWQATTTLVLEPNLRLVRADTRVSFDQQAADALFPDYQFSDEHKWLFETDHAVLSAVDQGRKLRIQRFLMGKGVKQQTIDYPPDSAPLDIMGLYLSAAIARGIDRFDFQLLIPGDGTHGIRVQVHRTRDLRKFAKGYRLPQARLLADETLAVLDMRLASPIKYLFYPHHFFMAFSNDRPDQLMMMWGGDADTHLQAVRK